MKRYIFCLLTLMSFLTISAKDYELNLGVNYLTGFASADCTFSPEQDGKVLIEAQEVYIVTYDGKTYDNQYAPGSGLAYSYEIADVKAGTAVKVHSDFVWNDNSVVKVTLFTDGQVIPVEAVNITPKQNTTFSWNNTGMITVNFNKTVTLSSIKFVVGDYVADVEEVHVSSSLGFNISNALNTALKTGKLTAGEKFEIQIKGLRDANDATNLYNGTGDMTLTYLAPYAQYGFKSATVGDYQLSYLTDNTYKFLSYYAKDSEDGLFVFEFEGNVGKVGSVTMSMGNLDLLGQGKYHRSDLPYTIEGNKLLVDARGTLRTLAVLFPAIVEEETGEEGGEAVNNNFDKEHVTITLSNVTDENGNAFLTNLSGSVGSYSFVMGYEELLDEAYIDGDNVADGDEVKAGQEIKLWLSNAGIKFEGLKVTYFVAIGNAEDENQLLEAREVLVKDFTVVEDAFEGVVITFNMPNMPEVASGSTIRVALDNASSADGMPHYLYIEFKAADGADCIRGIEGMAAAQQAAYRLSGVKGVGSDKGIVIKNGKKIVK